MDALDEADLCRLNDVTAVAEPPMDDDVTAVAEPPMDDDVASVVGEGERLTSVSRALGSMSLQ